MLTNKPCINDIYLSVLAEIFKSLVPKRSILFFAGMLVFSFLGYSQNSPLIVEGPTGSNANTSGSWVAPVTGDIIVECYGGGGAGGSLTFSTGVSGGGGGGAYSKSTFSVVQGQTYFYQVGAGASPSLGQPGGATWFNSTGVNVAPSATAQGVLAAGGSSVSGFGNSGATGGSAFSSIGQVKWAGGSGGNGSSFGGSYGGPGGSSARPDAAGSNGFFQNGGFAIGCQGAGANGPTFANLPGNPGRIPGGGGSGVFRNSNGISNGGAGAGGRIKISWTGPGVTSVTQGGVPVTEACAGSVLRITGPTEFCYCNGTFVTVLGSETTRVLTYSPGQSDFIDITIPCDIRGTGRICINAPSGETCVENFTVKPALDIALSPSGTQNISISGTGAQVTASNSGCHSVSNYQWGWRSAPGGSITNIPGQTNPAYIPNAADFTNTPGTYYLVCRLTGACNHRLFNYQFNNSQHQSDAFYKRYYISLCI
jgi:hypothetical protein